MNVVGNAIKFTDQGHVRIFNRCDATGHNTCVEDTGIGMSREEIDIALMPFRQVHGTSLARRYQGVGVGLSLSKEIMKQHDGDLFIESTSDGGTLVTLHFPPEAGQDPIQD